MIGGLDKQTKEIKEVGHVTRTYAHTLAYSCIHTHIHKHWQAVKFGGLAITTLFLWVCAHSCLTTCTYVRHHEPCSSTSNSAQFYSS